MRCKWPFGPFAFNKLIDRSIDWLIDWLIDLPIGRQCVMMLVGFTKMSNETAASAFIFAVRNNNVDYNLARRGCALRRVPFCLLSSSSSSSAVLLTRCRTIIAITVGRVSPTAAGWSCEERQRPDGSIIHETFSFLSRCIITGFQLMHMLLPSMSQSSCYNESRRESCDFVMIDHCRWIIAVSLPLPSY